jgi:hypothetical protein
MSFIFGILALATTCDGLRSFLTTGPLRIGFFLEAVDDFLELPYGIIYHNIRKKIMR